MSGTTLADFLAYWAVEGESYVRHGDYQWMAAQVPMPLKNQRVLEIGCGLGFGTEALLARGFQVLAVDSLPECLQATQARMSGRETETALNTLQADAIALRTEQRTMIEQFMPEAVVCWLMGAPAVVTGATSANAGQAVVAYREKIHRGVAELAAALPSVNYLHLVDRTAIHWQAKDIGRDTLVRYHSGKTLLDLPLTAERRHALYRKLGADVVDIRIRRANPAMQNVVPTLASLLVERKK